VVGCLSDSTGSYDGRGLYMPLVLSVSVRTSTELCADAARLNVPSAPDLLELASFVSQRVQRFRARDSDNNNNNNCDATVDDGCPWRCDDNVCRTSAESHDFKSPFHCL